MLNKFPTNECIKLVAQNAKYNCRLLLKYLASQTSIVKSGKCLPISSTCYRNYNEKDRIRLHMKDSYRMMAMLLRAFGKSLELQQAKISNTI